MLAILIGAVVLPSALNLPQANPSQVLEYAPVPPEKETPPQIQGAIASLGLGTTASLRTGLEPNPLQTGPGGQGKKPITKRCVGKPARQTEDPNSPPCVAFFEGDNGGATWQGVTPDQVDVLMYHQGGVISTHDEAEGGDTSAGEQYPSSVYCDLDLPTSAQRTCQDVNREGVELSVVAASRAYSRYFNERFQTYGRRVRVIIYWTGASNATGRRADANDNWQRTKPFAAMDRADFFGYNDVYAESMAGRRVSLFGSYGALNAAFFQKLSPNVWSFWPDVEHWADQFTDYMCRKVVPYPVSHTGNSSDRGKPRRLGLMSTSDKSWPGLQRFATLVDQGLQECGATIAERVKFPYAGYNIDGRTTPQYAIDNIAKMRQAGVTTVVWLGGMEAKTTPAADVAQWYPEWVVAGDRTIDTIKNARKQSPDVWQYAWVMSNQLREGRFEDSPARQAFREASPGARQIHEYWAVTMYREFFALFKALQVAGPYLSPDSVDQGQHAIPRQSSTTPYVAACFFDPGDYSCVKDAHQAWWDPLAPDPTGQPERGCWRMVREGKRYLPGAWEGADDVFANRNDPCNGVYGVIHDIAA